MALSNGNTFSGDLIFLNMRSKNAAGEKIAPHFEIAKAVAGAPGERSKITATGETATKVSGNLLRPRFVTREHKGIPNKHVVLYVKDGEETYNIDCTYRISTRSLFNALLCVTDPNNVEISIYESKKGYEALSLWQNGEMVPWKFDGRKGEIPESITVMFKGKEQHDYTPTDDFFEEHLKAWADEVFGPENAKSGSQQSQSSESESAEDTTPAESPEEVEAKTVTAASIANKTKAAASVTKSAPAKTTMAKTSAKSTAKVAPANESEEEEATPTAPGRGRVPF